MGGLGFRFIILTGFRTPVGFGRARRPGVRLNVL